MSFSLLPLAHAQTLALLFFLLLLLLFLLLFFTFLDHNTKYLTTSLTPSGKLLISILIIHLRLTYGSPYQIHKMHLLSALAVSSGLILSSFALPLAPVSESLTSARAIGLEKRELSVQINVFYNEGCAGPVDEVLTFWLPYGDGCYSPDRANSWQFFPAPGTLGKICL